MQSLANLKIENRVTAMNRQVERDLRRAASHVERHDDTPDTPILLRRISPNRTSAQHHRLGDTS